MMGRKVVALTDQHRGTRVVENDFQVEEKIKSGCGSRIRFSVEADEAAQRRKRKPQASSSSSSCWEVLVGAAAAPLSAAGTSNRQ